LASTSGGGGTRPTNASATESSGVSVGRHGGRSTGTGEASEGDAPRGRADAYYKAHRSATYDRIALRGPIF
jgi:hypothetical protein